MLSDNVVSFIKKEYRADNVRIVATPRDTAVVLPKPSEAVFIYTVELTYNKFDHDIVKSMNVTIGLDFVSEKKVELKY